MLLAAECRRGSFVIEAQNAAAGGTTAVTLRSSKLGSWRATRTSVIAGLGNSASC